MKKLNKILLRCFNKQYGMALRQSSNLPHFKYGDIVAHPEYGVGIVLRPDFTTREATYVVAFRKVFSNYGIICVLSSELRLVYDFPYSYISVDIID